MAIQSFENEVFSSLNSASFLNKGSLKLNDAAILKTIIKYMQQIGLSSPTNEIIKAIANNFQFSNLAINYFYAKLDPSFKNDRSSTLLNISNNIDNFINQVNNQNDKKIFIVFTQILKAIVRTNFFVGKEYISIKLHPKSIENLAKPVPFAEIFVYHDNFEAIHLRGGKVARGGLRWSDRIDDFRTEVLGLVKAQNIKNAVIVPVGSKGGFVIKADVSKLSRDEHMEFGKDCYRNFISACLDITDNIIDGKIIHPTNVIPTDGEDPYFVVAADKGTATFSDIANKISLQYNFWLGDAFASGGSNGYDHKKMGITAKGAWVATKRHFMEIAKNPEMDEITTIAIGDMSGDVFGNGLLRSKTINLIAAFNHLHIFIDPTPNPAKSFNERQRLFNLPRSSWMDYDKSAMSEGSAVYLRSEKSLKLTPQIKNLLNLSVDEISPNDLIITLLKHKVDLLWNGGIGTYVKATNENNNEVSDKANDAIRVNGSDLGAKIISEGGNLGFTQLGRIEAAKSGVMLNTDAMDNSAGVDCSDHEVNIKITLNSLVLTNKLSLDERNKILADMTEDVEDLVLLDNYEQTQAISISRGQKNTNLDIQADFIEFLEKEHFLDRENEFLPSKIQIQNLKQNASDLTRPELCVLFGYSKMYLYSQLLASNVIDDAFFDSVLLSYFPQQMQLKFKNDILNHKLKREIIATTFTNKTINRLGITSIYQIAKQTNSSYVNVAKAFIVANELLNADKYWGQIENADFKKSWQEQLQKFEKIISIIQQSILLILKNANLTHSINDIISANKTLLSQQISDIQK